MSEQTLNVKILLRNDTSTNWKTKNPVLENGELGIETDTRLMKFGDGTSTWTKLNYINTVTADEATHAARATTVTTNALNGQTKDLVSAFMAGSDVFRIQVGDTGDNNGYVSFDIGDDGNESIYFRQYFHDNVNWGTFANIVRQVTLLDSSGNTSFPGTVSAPTFSGNLTGNADSATNASYADSINIVSKNEIKLRGLSGYNGLIWFGYDAPAKVNEYRFGDGTKTGSLANITANVFNGNLHGTADVSVAANTVIGSYTGNGGGFLPNHFGKERVGFLMSSDLGGTYKNWLIMDNYGSDDVGGATALGLDRQQNRAYIMRSNADRQSWAESAELITSANISSQSVTQADHATNATNADTLGGLTLDQILILSTVML